MSGEARIIQQKMTPEEIQSLADETFSGEMVKLVVDITDDKLAAGGGMHYESETLLLEGGSRQEDLWGASYSPKQPEGQRVQYTSLINIRPAADNRSQEIQSPDIRKRVKQIIEKWMGPV